MSPIYKIMFEDFSADLDNLISIKILRKGDEPRITIDDFCEYFMKIHPWNDPLEMDGEELNIRRLLEAD